MKPKTKIRTIVLALLGLANVTNAQQISEKQYDVSKPVKALSKVLK
jgi:hypothetical protein